MRNLLLLTLLSALVLGGCKKDKDGDIGKHSIVAKWKMDKIEYVSYDQSGELYEKSTSVYDPSSYFEFKADRTFEYSILEAGEEEKEEDTGTYILSGNKLTLVFARDSEEYTVTTLNKNTLLFERTSDEDEGQIYHGKDIFYMSK